MDRLARALRFTLCVAVIGSACGEPTLAPQRLVAAYALRTVNGNPLPVQMAQGGGQRYLLLADTIRFDADGQVARTSVVRWISTDPTPKDTTYTQRLTLPYEIDGRKLVMGYQAPCAANALCIGWEDGTIDEMSATVVSHLFWPGEPRLVFTRL